MKSVSMLFLSLLTFNLISITQCKDATITISGGGDQQVIKNKNGKIEILAEGTDASDLRINVNRQQIFHSPKNDYDDESYLDYEDHDDDLLLGQKKGICWEVEQKYASMKRLYHNAISHEVKLNVAYAKLLKEVEKLGIKKGKSESEEPSGDDSSGDESEDPSSTYHDSPDSSESSGEEEKPSKKPAKKPTKRHKTPTKRHKTPTVQPTYEPSKSMMKWYILGGVGGLILCVVCIIVFFFMCGEDDEEDDIFIEEQVNDTTQSQTVQNEFPIQPSTEFPFEQTSQRPSNIQSVRDSTHDDIQRLTKDLKDYFGDKSKNTSQSQTATPQMPRMDSMRRTPMYIEHDISNTTSATPNRRRKSNKGVVDIGSPIHSK